MGAASDSLVDFAHRSLYAVGTRVVLHGLQADTLNLRRGTVVQCATAEDRVGVRLDGEVKPKSVRRVNVRLERGPHESGEPDELHEGFWCDGCGHFRGNDSPPSKSLRGTRYRCTRCAAIPGFDLCARCFGAGFAHACSATPSLSHENKTDCGPKEFDAAGFKALKDSQATAFAKWVETAAAEGELEERELVRQAMNFGDERGPRSAAVVNTIYRAQFPQGGTAGLKKLRGALMREEIDAQIQAAMANAGMGPQPAGAVPPVGPFGGQGPVQFGGIRVEGPGGVAMPQGLQAAAAQFGAQVAAGGGGLPFNIADVMGAQFGNFGFPLPTPGAAAAPAAGDDEASETPTVVEEELADESEAAVEPHLTEAPLEVAFNAAPAEPPVTGGGAPNIRRQRGRGLGDLISPDPEVRARAIAATTGDHTYDASRAPRWDDDGNPLT